MKGLIKSALKKVTLEMIYQVVDEKTEDIITVVNDIKKRQEDDFRYIIQKIDNDIGQLRTEVKNDIGQLKGEMHQFRNEVKNEIDQLRTEVKNEIGQLRQEMSQLNQRIDTIIQMLVNIRQQG